MKKLICIILSVIMLTGVFTGCQNKYNNKNKKLSIVTTIFPEYDWVMNVLGDNSANADVTMLLNSGVDLHSYQPTADDIIKISQCDVFIYVGGESDEWVNDALKEATNKNMIVINLLDALNENIKTEEIKEGMEAEDDSKEEPEYDEHVWLSLKNAAVIANVIRDALCKIDKNNAETYSANASTYIEKLNILDKKYQSAVNTSRVKTVVFGDRFPFRYLVDDYNLDYFAAFAGCSAESEASFETIMFLSEKVSNLGLSAVLTLENTDNKIAKTIVSTLKDNPVKILSMDSMQSTTSNDVKSGADYLSIMEKNLTVLTEALQ